jgi:predicted membrane-bound spermidine synthase
MSARRPILATAFFEGFGALVVEIAGARAVAPFYGDSLQVWTAQITATLACLALGYGLGGRLALRRGALPWALWGAGAWLALFPLMRSTVLAASLAIPSVPGGALAASLLLFGPALVGLGAVSPILIQGLHGGADAGSAAGSVFLTNTLGGLAGGWATALWLVPGFSLRLVLAGTGVGLALVGSLWAWRGRRAATLLAPLALAGLALLTPGAARSQAIGAEGQLLVLRRQATSVGLLQVMDVQVRGYSQGLLLCLDGITQGGMDRASGLTEFEFTEYLARLSWRYQPHAKRALLLGLGTGLLAKQLVERGLSVDAAEIEPAVAAAARDYFGLPAAVAVHIDDGRAYLQRSPQAWDLVFLDAYAGETTPWYLLTREGLALIRRHLAPGGRLLINGISLPQGSAGLARMEASLRAAFPEAKVFIDQPRQSSDPAMDVDLVNVVLVAGEGLKAVAGAYPGRALPGVMASAEALEGRGRDARPDPGLIDTDDRSALDAVEAPLRAHWRRSVLKQLGADLLGD